MVLGRAEDTLAPKVSPARKSTASRTRTTFTINSHLLDQARMININISAAACEGVKSAVRAARLRSDQEAYRNMPEQPDPFWDEAEAWGEE